MFNELTFDHPWTGIELRIIQKLPENFLSSTTNLMIWQLEIRKVCKKQNLNSTVQKSVEDQQEDVAINRSSRTEIKTRQQKS